MSLQREVWTLVGLLVLSLGLRWVEGDDVSWERIGYRVCVYSCDGCWLGPRCVQEVLDDCKPD